MTTFGICTVKNAADIIGPVVAHMLEQVDHVIVADNLSTDGTYEILESVGSITLLTDDDPAHRQSVKMTRLAYTAADMGAEWVVPFDADEWWYTPHAETISDRLAELDRYAVARADLFDHVTTEWDDSNEANPVKRIGWRRRLASPMPKVACRVRDGLTILDGNHGATYDRWKPRTAKQQLVVRHFPYRSEQQFVKKAVEGAAALKLTDLPESTGAHWRQYAAIAESEGPTALGAVYLQFFHAINPREDATLIFDPAP